MPFEERGLAGKQDLTDKCLCGVKISFERKVLAGAGQNQWATVPQALQHWDLWPDMVSTPYSLGGKPDFRFLPGWDHLSDPLSHMGILPLAKTSCALNISREHHNCMDFLSSQLSLPLSLLFRDETDSGEVPRG